MEIEATANTRPVLASLDGFQVVNRKKKDHPTNLPSPLGPVRTQKRGRGRPRKDDMTAPSNRARVFLSAQAETPKNQMIHYLSNSQPAGKSSEAIEAQAENKENEAFIPASQ